MTDPASAIERALAYLAAMEARDLDTAGGFVVATDLELIFPGGRTFANIRDIVANSSGRYRFVKKRIETRDGWISDGRVRVMIAGTLYGEWPDGSPFDGIRFVDWFEFEGDRILKQHVWNDAGERLIAMQKEAGT
ncbi:nuclear transport factor 2-like protein [Chachezhania sediminis]|uniref:hypothetical protein n=1 Tax=Chachezhania sediminis TaxID=2599291 RepID=UPI00131CCFC6|nr:hypothetical protein [Chachezhania sediminis]